MMAKSLANLIYRGMAASQAARSTATATGSFYRGRLQFSTTVPNDPDTHDDFKPTSKLKGPEAESSLRDSIEKDVKENPVMIFMKGLPNAPQCGFSALAVRILNEYGVPLSARNILVDPTLKEAVKAYSHWPTFPQVFINGEFVGGSDILLKMHQGGELEGLLKDAAAKRGNAE